MAAGATAAEIFRAKSTGDFQFNSGYGSVATAYGCRAWVNFNGTGTVAIRASGNVSSITDNDLGDYTVNFTTAMPDANYSVAGMISEYGVALGAFFSTPSTPVQTTTTTRLVTLNRAETLRVDCSQITVAIFR
jgi:hypothetical protein